MIRKNLAEEVAFKADRRTGRSQLGGMSGGRTSGQMESQVGVYSKTLKQEHAWLHKELKEVIGWRKESEGESCR